MANPDHVERTKQGVITWNTWRENFPDIRVNLRGANLSGANLSYANLSSADLSHAKMARSDLSHAKLVGARLSDANLTKANLSEADLSEASLSITGLSYADLSGADLSSADLSGSNLNQANLSQANLSGSNLYGTRLHGAQLQGIHLYHTIFAGVDLCVVEGLDKAIHDGPSSVDVKTVKLPEGATRTHFLRGVGFSDAFIDYLPSLPTVAIQYESCFLSYAHQDEALARRLYKDLQEKGVRCWFAPHDLRPGTLFHRGIEDAIHLHEKVLLLLSEHALQSNWIEHEVEMTLNRQAHERRDLLFPLRLDEAVMQAKEPWAVRLRDSRQIGDFTLWQNDKIYHLRFAELLRHLKVKIM